MWTKITSRFKDDKELNTVAQNVASNPDSEFMQQMLTQILAKRLEEAPDFSKELLAMLGGEKRLQEIIVGNESTIKNVRQAMAGSGTQTIKGGDKTIVDNATQEQTQ